ncbi:MAG TPA: site-specific integrase [Desulfomonilia bacterium]
MLNLIRRITSKKGLCVGLGLSVQKPRVDNVVTEDLSPDELRRLLIAIEADSNRIVANMMLMALNTGMRRGELLKLQCDDVNFNTGFIKIKAPGAGVPKNLRPMHGLRHAYASMLASSEQVDVYTLQKLMTHKDFRMTQRYAHLRDEALKKASGIVGEIIDKAFSSKSA